MEENAFYENNTFKSKVKVQANYSVICSGTIGNRCVIGAGSVVTKDIPDDSVAVGNPARVIRK